jgi:hypothetical protein
MQNPPLGRVTKSLFPAAVTWSKSNDASFKNLGAIVHPETGMEGERYAFRQIMFPLIGTNDGTQSLPLRIVGTLSYAVSGFLQSAIVSGGTSFTGWYMSPFYQSGRLAIIANIFTDYVYRKLQIRYIPQTGTNVSNSQSHGLAFGLNSDPYIWPEDGNGTGIPTYLEVTQVQPGFQCSAYGSMSDVVDCLKYEYNGKRTWKNQFSQAITGETAADLREEHQLRLCAMDNYVGTPATTMLGNLEMSGVIDFFGPVQGLASSGFGSVLRSEHAKSISTTEVDRLRVAYDEKQRPALLAELKAIDDRKRSYADQLTKPLRPKQPDLLDEKSSWLTIGGARKGQAPLVGSSKSPSIHSEEGEEEVPVRVRSKQGLISQIP